MSIAIGIIDRYPEEPFDPERQQEWARAVVDRLYAYSTSTVHTISRRGKNGWKEAM